MERSKKGIALRKLLVLAAVLAMVMAAAAAALAQVGAVNAGSQALEQHVEQSGTVSGDGGNWGEVSASQVHHCTTVVQEAAGQVGPEVGTGDEPAGAIDAYT